jgi:DNA-binding transcriptional LysR family regulator
MRRHLGGERGKAAGQPALWPVRQLGLSVAGRHAQHPGAAAGTHLADLCHRQRRTDWTLLSTEPGAAVERIERRSSAPARVRAGSISPLLQTCLAGLGIPRLPLHTVQAHAADELQPVLPGWTPQPVPVHAVFPSSRFIAPKVRAFIDHALAAFEPPAH